MRADFRRGISRLTGFAREQQASAIGELLPFAVAAESSGKPPLDAAVEVAAKLTFHIFRHRPLVPPAGPDAAGTARIGHARDPPRWETAGAEDDPSPDRTSHNL